MDKDTKDMSINDLYKMKKPISQNFKYYKKFGIEFLFSKNGCR